MAPRTNTISISTLVCRRTLFVLMAGFCVLATLVFCQWAPAQDQPTTFKQLDMAPKYFVEMAAVDADKAELRRIRLEYKEQVTARKTDLRNVKSALESSANASTQLVTDFLEGYEFPAMTITDPRVISSLGEKRTKFIKNYLNPKITGGARRSVIDVTIKSTQAICANKDLHPAARLNAVYLLGQLDDVAANRISNQAPQPSKAAFASMMKILASNDAVAFPGYVKIAALAGIQRHLEIESIAGRPINAADRQALMAQIDNALKSGQKDDLSYWLKRRSMQMAGLIGDPAVLDTAISILGSPEAGMWLQLDAVEAIGKLNLAPVPATKRLDASVAITDFLATAYGNEAKFIEASIDKLVFDTILFQDIDLVVSGTNYQDNTPAETNGTTDDTRGRDNKGGSGSGVKSGMGGAGSPGEGGPSGGSQGGGVASVTIDPNARLDLPNYQLDNVRRRIKSLAFVSRNALGEEQQSNSGLRASLDADGQAFVDKVVRLLDDTLDKSNVGIKDRDPRARRGIVDEEEDTETVTEQLKLLCKDASEALDSFARKQKGDPADDGGIPKPDGDTTDGDTSN